MKDMLARFLSRYVVDFYFPKMYFTDFLEILILAFLIYHLIVWVKNTKAWMLLKGILVLAAFILVAAILQMHTILFLAKNLVTVMATALVVVFQPELRRVLEKIGERKFFSSMAVFDANREKA